MNKFTSAFISINFLFLAACSSNAPVTTNKAGTVSKEQVVTVKQATVTSVKKVAVLGKRYNAGRTVGSITGSILGSSGTIAGSILGSMIGGAVGSEADKAVSKKPGLEITLQLDNGEKVVVTQLAETSFKAGDKVKLIMQDNKAQVAHL